MLLLSNASIAECYTLGTGVYRIGSAIPAGCYRIEPENSKTGSVTISTDPFKIAYGSEKEKLPFEFKNFPYKDFCFDFPEGYFVVIEENIKFTPYTPELK